MRDIFYCYSMRVKEFLCDNGYPFILTGYHEPSGRRYSIINHIPTFILSLHILLKFTKYVTII